MIRGVKSVAEYAIRRWLQQENFVMSNFKVVMNEHEATIEDKNGDRLTLVYDSAMRSVYVKD